MLRDGIRAWFRTRTEIVAENLFLRRQLALYQERKTRRRRPTPATKVALVVLSRFFPWMHALSVVKPGTFVRWHRAGFRLLWRWKSRSVGRPPLPSNLRTLILTMAGENPSWGEGRIADELSLKLGLLVDPRTVGKYLKQGGRPRPPAVSVGRRSFRITRMRSSLATTSPRSRRRSRSCTCLSRSRSARVASCTAT